MAKATGRCACGRLVYNGHRDECGRPAHPCCVREGPDCGACKASDAAERHWSEHGIKWARKVKAHWKAEAERNQPTQEER
jgi:hypothetical protein